MLVLIHCGGGFKYDNEYAEEFEESFFGPQTGTQMGTVTFYIAYTFLGVGNIVIFINDNYAGELSAYYNQGSPSCGLHESGKTVTVDLQTGNYFFEASYQNTTPWNGSFQIKPNECIRIALK